MHFPTTKSLRFCAFLLAAVILPHARAFSQDVNEAVVNLAGPRFGLTMLSSGITDKLRKDNQINISQVITQFGWQSEKRFASSPDGFTGISELVFLAGGLEQGQFLPSASWLIGFRTAEGVEFGVGPNVTPISASLAFAFGITQKAGNLNIPVNLAIVPSSSGLRVSILSGFNLRK